MSIAPYLLSLVLLVSCSSKPIFDKSSEEVRDKISTCEEDYSSYRDGGVSVDQIEDRRDCVKEFLRYYKGLDHAFLEVYMDQLDSWIKDPKKSIEDPSKYTAQDLSKLNRFVLEEAVNRYMVLNSEKPKYPMNQDEKDLVGARSRILDNAIHGFYRTLKQSEARYHGILATSAFEQTYLDYLHSAETELYDQYENNLNSKIEEISSKLSEGLNELYLPFKKRAALYLLQSILKSSEINREEKQCEATKEMLLEQINTQAEIFQNQYLDDKLYRSHIEQRPDEVEKKDLNEKFFGIRCFFKLVEIARVL